ncbi:MAG: hypothetical protein JWR59_366, partial [Brevundimonas sp.]|nr:hypothetical protein [Brevundimonas sp.]
MGFCGWVGWDEPWTPTPKLTDAPLRLAVAEVSAAWPICPPRGVVAEPEPEPEPAAELEPSCSEADAAPEAKPEAVVEAVPCPAWVAPFKA